MNEIEELYQDIISSHNQKPVHFLKLNDAQHQVKAYNPVCGDQYNVYFDIEDDRISRISFYGHGCAISKASTSILIKQVLEKQLDEVFRKYEDFRIILDIDSDIPEGLKEEIELMAFSGVRRVPSRLNCALMSWESFISYLKKQ